MEIEQFGNRMIELLPKLIRGVAQYEHNYLTRGEITLPQLWVLECLSRQGDCPMRDLSQSLRISKPAATGLIDRLIAQKLVRREGDKEDRRIVRVSITPKGRKIIASIWEQKRNSIIKVFGEIPAADRAQYITTLERVVANLTQQKQE